MFTIQTSVTTA